MEEVRAVLDEAYDRFARPEFVLNDPVQVPRCFAKRKDVEIMAFLTATIAWGQRRTIISNAQNLAKLMDETPFDFVMNATRSDLSRLDRFVHRTFNGIDLHHFIRALRHLYTAHGGLESAFLNAGEFDDIATAIMRFRARFFEIDHPKRTLKHVADPGRGSHAKRINLFLRWMVRPADRGIDLGLWKRIPLAALHVPLDIHTGRVSRALGLLHRQQDDWKSVMELTGMLQKLDPVDPIRYDLALFALGVETSQQLAVGQRVSTTRATRMTPRSSLARSR